MTRSGDGENNVMKEVAEIRSPCFAVISFKKLHSCRPGGQNPSEELEKQQQTEYT